MINKIFIRSVFPILLFVIALLFLSFIPNEKDAAFEPHPLYVLVAVDEEYRNTHEDWQIRAKEVVEQADDLFNNTFNIDFQVTAVGKWESDGLNSKEILQDLKSNWDNPEYDFIVGITLDENFTEGGIAPIYKEKPKKSAYSVVYDQGDRTYQSLQHELSHNFGLSHHPEDSEIKCIMNYSFLYKISEWDPDHLDQLKKNVKWYIDS
ncbi:zinc-dependent metalloprotease [Metabacillus litoralis]|uniref:zinc-dependent metalloprotease n=1 Tax=Metabacillus TaxID=2675233 RepID=UPI001B9C5DC2|nr:zinc-dependent metalloprotease [Metabacillus litoralis]UHA61617.1 zinc-dependent metalloprotease [Metabacillus litoralis]